MEYKLIMAVSGFPSLYDRNSATYRDLSTRSAAWRQVAEMVGVPEAECRRKWKMLRDQHRRERLREKERRESGVGLLNYRPWRYSAILAFLNPFIDARAAGTNGWALEPRSARLRPLDPTGCSTTSESRSDDDDNYGFAIADATTTTSSSSEPVQRKRASSASAVTLKEEMTDLMSAVSDDGEHTHGIQQREVRELLELLVHSVTSLAASLPSSHQLTAAGTASQPGFLKTEKQEDGELPDPPGKEACPRTSRPDWGGADGAQEEVLRRTEGGDVEHKDDVTLFLLSLAPALRRLPVQKQSWVRTKIQQLVHEAEFGPTDS